MSENTNETSNVPSTPAAIAEKAKAAKKPAKAKTAKAAAKGKKAVKPAKKPAKAKVAANGDRLVPADLSTYHVDKDKKTTGGNPSVDCDDKVAVLLRGKSLDDAYKLCASKTDTPEKDLRARYKHLNVGMQRMNLGNKLRAVVQP